VTKDDHIDLTEKDDMIGEGEPGAALVKSLKRKNASLNDPGGAKRAKVSPVVWARETSGFRVLRTVTLQNRRYAHLCTVFNQHLHFWSVVTYKNKTWIGGKENLGGLKFYGDDEFVTQADFM